MVVYGIKTCGSVKKALTFFKNHAIDVEFIDIRQEPVSGEKLDYWLSYVDIDTLLNTKGTKYRTLELKELQLDDEDKREWLLKEPLLIKRPVVESERGVHVGYDEKVYTKLFLH